MQFLAPLLMQLQLQTWQDVETYLQRSQGILVPIGSTEQHGPTGPIGTDALCAQAIAGGVGEATQTLVGPTLHIGMALHHTAFPGTVSLRPITLIGVVQDYLASLASAGFRRFFFINGHGGNIATLQAAFAQSYERLAEMGVPHAAEVRAQLGNWFLCRGVRELAQQYYGDAEGSHATASEIALMQYLYPEAIKPAPAMAQAPAGHPIYSAADFRRHYPDGRMGSNPSLSQPEHGERFYATAVEELAQDYRAFVQAE